MALKFLLKKTKWKECYSFALYPLGSLLCTIPQRTKMMNHCKCYYHVPPSNVWPGPLSASMSRPSSTSPWMLLQWQCQIWIYRVLGATFLDLDLCGSHRGLKGRKCCSSTLSLPQGSKISGSTQPRSIIITNFSMYVLLEMMVFPIWISKGALRFLSRWRMLLETSSGCPKNIRFLICLVNKFLSVIVTLFSFILVGYGFCYLNFKSSSTI